MENTTEDKPQNKRDSNSAVTVRYAQSGDFGAASTLLAELGRPRITPATARASQAVWERHIAHPNTASLVAESGGEVIGFLSLQFRERLNCAEPQGWIPDLIVTEAARGRGAGRALLERAFAEAKAHGCDRVTLESGYTRTVAHRVYEAVGMINHGYFFTARL